MTRFVWAEIIWTRTETWTMPVRIGAVGVAAIAGALVLCMMDFLHVECLGPPLVAIVATRSAGA